MSIAFDASSSSSGTDTGDFNWTHTPSGTPRGVLVMVIQEANATDQVNGITYGGEAMTEVPGTPYSWTASIDDACFSCYWLGSSIPTGAQTVAVDVDATGSTKKAVAITVTAADDTIIEDVATTGVTNGSNPSVSLTTTRETVVLFGMHSGNAVLSAISAGSGLTEIVEVDWGPNVSAWGRSTSVHAAGSFSVGWISSAGTSQAALGVAIAEYAAVTGSAAQANETDLAQAVAWAPKHRLVNIGSSTEIAQAITASTGNDVAVLQVEETDTAQSIRPGHTITANQATETDLAQPLSRPQTIVLGQANETDLAQGVLARRAIGQAQETDTALAVTVFSYIGTTIERDRAQQVGVLGGTLPISGTPILIRAPRKAGRIFHEIYGAGETHHPSIGEWEATEDAPGGFRGAKGLISSRIYDAHREAFRAGALWRTFLEDGTCIFAGKLKQPDPQSTVVELTADGRAAIADKVIGPLMYQTHVGSEFSHLSNDRNLWQAEFATVSHGGVDTSLVFRRKPDPDAPDDEANVVIPFFGREVAFLRFHMQGRHGEIFIETTQATKLPFPNSSAELDLHPAYQTNYYYQFGTTQTAENVGVDLVLTAEYLNYPNQTEFENAPDGVSPLDTGYGFFYPNVILIFVSDWASTPSDSTEEILLANIEVNGAPVGRSRRYDVGDLVEDVAARLGFREFRTGGAYNILPYEIPPGGTAAEALDWASLVSGKRWRILDTGSHATFEFDWWNRHEWGLASPWSPLRTIPEERYDAVAIPYSYPGTHGQLTDQVVVRVDDSPLLGKRTNWNIDLPDPAHNRDKASDLGMRIAEDLINPRYSGDFACAEIIGPDGQKLSAHHMNAGDTLFPWRRSEPGRLWIGRLTRFEDHVEGEFDGQDRSVNRLLERRAKRIGSQKR